MGDFNVTTTNPLLHELIDNFNMSSLINEPVLNLLSTPNA